MLCKFCNHEIPDGAEYCPKCGKPLKKDDALAERPSAPPPPPPEDKPAPPPPPPKKKGLVFPIILMLVAAAGWLYILSSNSIEGVIAWFKSTADLNDSVSQQYNYFGNNFSTEELIGNILFIAIMVLLTLLGIIGIIIFIKRLIRKFKGGRPPKA